MKIIDCRKMACPLPVVTVKRALAEAAGHGVRVLLDDGPPRENVTRYAVTHGFSVEETPAEGGWSLVISGEPGGTTRASARREGPSVLLVASDRLGDGPEELARLLMKNFIMTLVEVPEVPDQIFFINTGVLLATEGSEVVEALEQLGNRGTEVFSCGVCLDFFHRRDNLLAGRVTNMFTIAETLLKAGSVVRM